MNPFPIPCSSPTFGPSRHHPSLPANKSAALNKGGYLLAGKRARRAALWGVACLVSFVWPRSLTAATPSSLRITSIEVRQGMATVRWEGGKAPYQLLYRNSTGDAWRKAGPQTSNQSASHPLSGYAACFYRVTTDVTPPTVSLTSPSGGSTLNGLVSLTANASDNVAVQRVEFYCNGIKIGTDETVPYTFELNTTALPDGAHTLYAMAADAADNARTSSSVSVTIANRVQGESGQTLWARSFGGTGIDFGQSVTSDREGNVILTGTFDYRLDFGGGPLPVPFLSGRNMLLAKYTSSGDHVWSQALGGAGNGECADSVTDHDENIVIGGQFAGNLVFSTITLTGWDAPFISKFDANGNHLWSRCLGGNGKVNGVATLSNGDVIATGYSSGTDDFGPGIFAARYASSNGRLIWSNTFGSRSTDAGNSVAVDTLDNVIVVGSFYGPIDFGGGSVTSQYIDAFAVKFTANGSHIWTRTYGSSRNDAATSVAICPDNSIVLAGHFRGDLNLGNDSLHASEYFDEVFLCKLDSAGLHQWSRQIGGDENDYANEVASDGRGNIVVTGNFRAAVSFGGGGTISTGGYDAFIAKYSGANGEFIWVRPMGNQLGTDEGLGIAVTPSDDVIGCGKFYYSINSGTDVLTSQGECDMYLLRIAP